MVAAYKSIGAVVSGAASVSVSPAWGTHASGDRGVLVVVQGRSDSNTDPGAATLATANGFTAIAGAHKASTYSDGFFTSLAAHITCFEAEATSGAMAAPTVNGAGGCVSLAFIIVFDGAAVGGSAVDVVSTPSANNSTSTAVTIAGTTTTVDNTLVLAVLGSTVTGASPNVSSWANTDLSSFTERADTTANNIIISCATGDKATADAYGNTTATGNGSGAWAGLTIAIKSLPATVDGSYALRPRSGNLMRNDPRLASLRAAIRTPDLRRALSVRSPDGYSRGENRSGVGYGYLNDREPRFGSVPLVFAVHDTYVQAPRSAFKYQHRTGRHSHQDVALAPATIDGFASWSPASLSSAPYDSILTAGATVGGSSQHACTITVTIAPHDGIAAHRLTTPPSDFSLFGCTNATGWIDTGSAWSAVYTANSDPMSPGTMQVAIACNNIPTHGGDNDVTATVTPASTEGTATPATVTLVIAA